MPGNERFERASERALRYLEPSGFPLQWTPRFPVWVNVRS